MKRVGVVSAFVGCVWAVAHISPAEAALAFNPGETDVGARYLVIEGVFEPTDDLAVFEAAVRSQRPSFVTFNSPGGTISKAMQTGRLVRALRLDTVQPRGLECASACALAFLGGVSRYAEPGAIGVHRSSFGEDASLTVKDAVRTVQQLTAEIMNYVTEMGADSGLLQLSLQYDSNDIRYLSKSEMEHYRVVSLNDPAQVSNVPVAPTPYAPNIPGPNRILPLPRDDESPSRSFPPGPIPWFETAPLPVPVSGRVQHPKYLAPLRAFPFDDSFVLRRLTNGEPVAILESKNNWYRVQAGPQTGWVSKAWIWVEQFGSGPFGKQHIQIASFSDFAATEAYIRGFHDYPIVAYLATTGLFAVTIDGQFEEDVAKRTVESLKFRGLVPSDAFATYGNTYVRRVCCN